MSNPEKDPRDIAKAPYEYTFALKNYEDVTAGIIKWPMSVIRLQSKDADSLAAASNEVLEKWRSYTDEEAFIYCETDGVPHNTITPIARMKGDLYEMDLLSHAIVEDRNLRTIAEISKHADWVEEWKEKYAITADNIKTILQKEIESVFVKVLECSGVFKRTEQGARAFKRFFETL